MTASSLAPGAVPVSQFAGSFQLPEVAFFQFTVAMDFPLTLSPATRDRPDGDLSLTGSLFWRTYRVTCHAVLHTWRGGSAGQVTN